MPSFSFVPPATSAHRARQILDQVPERWDKLDPDLAAAVRTGADLSAEEIFDLADVCKVPSAYLACLPGIDCPLGVAARLPGWVQQW